MAEQIDHPEHYGGKDNPYEAIKVIEAWALGFSLGNAVKYISRAGKKASSSTLTDLQKARWYIDREIQKLSTAAVMPVAAKVPPWPSQAAPPATATSSAEKAPELFDNLYSDAKNAGAAVATSTMAVVAKYKRGEVMTDAENALYALWAETNEPSVPEEVK